MIVSWLKSSSRRWRGRTDDDAGSAALQTFRAAVKEGLNGDRASLEKLLQMPSGLGLAEEEAELELDMIRGALDLVSLREAVARDGLPVVQHQHKALGNDRCHFRSSAVVAADTGNRPGRLFLTDRRILFLASPLLALPWSAIIAVEAEERDMVVRTVTGRLAYRFHCNSFSDAECGAFIAQTLLQHARRESSPPGTALGTDRISTGR